MLASEIVNKVWNYANVLRDGGVVYGLFVSLNAPVEKITVYMIEKSYL
jgi:hypothetical protein